MYIHKWLLYLIIVLTVFLVFILPTLIFTATAKETTGSVVEILLRESGGRRSYTRRFAVFEYEAGGKYYHCISQPYVFDQPFYDMKASILYNPRDPDNGRINNFYGTWGRTFIWVLPLFLFTTLCFLAINFIPTRVQIPSFKAIDKKLFG